MIAGFCLIFACNIYFSYSITRVGSPVQTVPMNAEQILARCAMLKMMPGPPDDFSDREESDRWEHGTNATLIRNATVWTGARNGEEVIRGDVLFDRGVVKAVGHVPENLLRKVGRLTVVEAHEAWVTTGLGKWHPVCSFNSPTDIQPLSSECRAVGLHSHVGLFSWPSLSGSCNGFFSYNLPFIWSIPRRIRPEFLQGPYPALAPEHRFFQYAR